MASYRKRLVTHNGISADIDLYFSICDHCGVEQADWEEMLQNKLRMEEFVNRVDKA